MVTGALLHSDTNFLYYVVLVVQTQTHTIQDRWCTRVCGAGAQDHRGPNSRRLTTFVSSNPWFILIC